MNIGTIKKLLKDNTKTERISEKSIYYSENKGFYFKGNSSYWTKTPRSRYYINDLDAIE